LEVCIALLRCGEFGSQLIFVAGPGLERGELRLSRGQIRC